MNHNPAEMLKRLAESDLAIAKEIKAHHASLKRPSKQSIRALDLIPTYVANARRRNHMSIQARNWTH